MGTLSLGREPGQREKVWKLWKDHFERATRWMAVTNSDQLDLLLLVGGEELQKLIQTLPEQQVAHQKAGSTLQGESQQHFGVVQVVQHRMDT